jgi:hypothetical protein
MPVWDNSAENYSPRLQFRSRRVNIDVKPAEWRAGEPIESGEFCDVYLAVDHRGDMPCVKEFFNSRTVGDQDVKKMVARIRLISRSGFPANEEAYKRFGDLHYVKTHGFRAYCFGRLVKATMQLVVCVVESKKSDDSLNDDVATRARRRFQEHCERYPPS